jgi:hypothetical protein
VRKKYSAGISFLLLEREACVEDSPPERIGSRPAMRKRANFAPRNKYEIDGEQNLPDVGVVRREGGFGLTLKTSKHLRTSLRLQPAVRQRRGPSLTNLQVKNYG